MVLKALTTLAPFGPLRDLFAGRGIVADEQAFFQKCRRRFQRINGVNDNFSRQIARRLQRFPGALPGRGQEDDVALRGGIGNGCGCGFSFRVADEFFDFFVVGIARAVDDLVAFAGPGGAECSADVSGPDDSDFHDMSFG